jgi:hypothetical protein
MRSSENYLKLPRCTVSGPTEAGRGSAIFDPLLPFNVFDLKWTHLVHLVALPSPTSWAVRVDGDGEQESGVTVLK